LTARDAEADKLRGFALGGDDYITKTASPLEIIARIKAVLRRSRGGASETPDLVLRYGDLCIDTKSCEVTVGGVVASMTAREYELLLLLAKHPRRLFSRDELFERLWGEIGDRHTVTVHIGRIRDKIERDPQNPRYVATIRGMGYRFEGDMD
jgi:DNA-binding response OmpR family regulator